MPDRCLLYYITDRTQFPGDEPVGRQALLAKIAEAARAGVDYVQLREKDLSTKDLESLAYEVVNVVHQAERPATSDQRPAAQLLINSRTDVALAVGADGVHLRSDDPSPREVRGVVKTVSGHRPLTSDHFHVAVSCHSPADVLRAASDGADLAVFAPVFEKKDRPGAQPAGLDALREACQAKIPVLALGGVTLANAAACLEAGAAGIAAIRLFQENNIEEVVRALRHH
jgi:thiamine-phosphate pyrophosphorylase